MSFSCRILNGICKMLYSSEHRKFLKPCNISEVQNNILMSLVQKNADTVYGKKYNFSDIKSYSDFVKNVPLTVYEDYEPYIERISDGEEKVLTAEKVMLFELTSGSSGGKKLVPYTQSLKTEFQRGIKPWICDIYERTEGVCEGRSYWSVTPVTAGKTFTKCGIPVGFEEDTEYFGAVTQAVMKKIFAVDSSVKLVSDMNEFYFKTSEQLIECPELSLISVWNPTFLTILCSYISENAESLSEGLGTDRKNALIKTAGTGDFTYLFPNLKIISCWADGSAADQIDAVKKLFPDVYIQPKGLLATECFVSFPLVGEEGSRLSIYSHFFEFRNLEDDTVCMADKLKKGEYEVIVTTGGGFYRYCIGDIIEVMEVFDDRPPLIRFLRRRGITSDLFGEKLTEEFVRNTVTGLGIKDEFCLLAPEGDCYCLYTSAENISSELLDNALRESYHYDYCRSLGQLKQAMVSVVSGNPQNAYIRRLSDDGMRIGDIKPAYLSKKSGWDKYFEKKG